MLGQNIVDPVNLGEAKAATIYSSFTDTLPPPKVVYKYEFPWDLVWSRLWCSAAMTLETDLMFRLIHNILPIRGRLGKFGIVNGKLCPYCRKVEESVIHCFALCPRVATTWEFLLAKFLPIIGPQNDETVLFLAWQPTTRLDNSVSISIKFYANLVWSTRASRSVLMSNTMEEWFRSRPKLFKN